MTTFTYKILIDILDKIENTFSRESAKDLLHHVKKIREKTYMFSPESRDYLSYVYYTEIIDRVNLYGLSDLQKNTLENILYPN